jgi:hypothetical protein
VSVLVSDGGQRAASPTRRGNALGAHSTRAAPSAAAPSVMVGGFVAAAALEALPEPADQQHQQRGVHIS